MSVNSTTSAAAISAATHGRREAYHGSPPTSAKRSKSASSGSSATLSGVSAAIAVRDRGQRGFTTQQAQELGRLARVGPGVQVEVLEDRQLVEHRVVALRPQVRDRQI